MTVSLLIESKIDAEEMYNYIETEMRKIGKRPNCSLNELISNYNSYNEHGTTIYRLTNFRIGHYASDILYDYTWKQYRIKKTGIVKYK